MLLLGDGVNKATEAVRARGPVAIGLFLVNDEIALDTIVTLVKVLFCRGSFDWLCDNMITNVDFNVNAISVV